MSGMPHNNGLHNMPDFDILEWHPAYLSCTDYFVNHAQHENATRALCALINIRLPYQWSPKPVTGNSTTARSSNGATETQQAVSLIPYIRRLIVTGFDKDGILHGFFGNDWIAGIGPLRECERRNYAFTAKTAGWSATKQQYDMNQHETVPFMKPLLDARMEELDAAN